MKEKKGKPSLLTDTSEKPHKRWMWAESDMFGSSKLFNIQNGDYGFEGGIDNGWLYLEKKSSCFEIYSNLFTKDWNRFKDCLERIKDYKYKYIIVEASVSDIYYQRPKRAKVNPEGVLKKIIEISLDYDVHILFCGSSAKTVALSLLKRAYERWKKTQ